MTTGEQAKAEVLMVISKETAAVRQLETAIELFFEDRDPISVHTLASASGEIIDQMCKSNGHISFRQRFLEIVRPEFQDAVGIAINKPRNFFKHGSHLDVRLDDFNPDVNFSVLLGASYCLDLLNIYNIHSRCFVLWAMMAKPKLAKMPLTTLIPDLSTIEINRFQQLSPARQKSVGLDLLRHHIAAQKSNAVI